ncbi:MAG: hypothetical protein MJ002_00785 [Paludibacteraceae bacterium]|nr:hypothetical protein [Paludibacteraceae bacterium]
MINWRRFRRLISSKDTVAFFGFFLLSCVIWVMYTIGTQREITMVAPVVYYGVPDDVKMDEDFPSEIEFTIADEGSQVWRYAFAKIDTIEIDLSDKFHGKSRKHIKIDYESYVKDIAYNISQTCEIVSIDPSDYQSDYQQVFTKRVPVVMTDMPVTGNEFAFVGPPVISPSEVRIRGTHSAVGEVSCVYLDTIGEPINENKTIRLKPKRIRGIEILDRDVRVTFKIERLTEKAFTLPVTVKNVPDGISVRVFPSVVNVVFKVGLSRYQQLNALGLSVLFDYNAIDEGVSTIPLRLESDYQLGNIDYKVVPDKVEFIIEKQ